MLARNTLRGSYRLGLTSFLMMFVVTSMLPPTAKGQGLEMSGGWAHVTGDFGTDGFNVGAAWWFTKRITAAVDYESSWDTTSLSTFAFTQTGPFAVKSHLQSVVVGPRIFFTSKWTDKYKVNPFAEAQFGASHLSQDLQQTTGTTSASDTAFSWLLGGGVEYLFSPHWSGRTNLDFMRTHLSNEGQSRLRLLVEITYTFGSRERTLATPEPAASHQSVSAVATSPARVHITSSPTGGEIYVDGKLYGNTPSEIILYTGDHTVKVVANGKEWSRIVHITAGDIHIEADLSQP
jgi:PEGA domain/Outer membrane protein beta-barrel domain